MAEIQIKKDTTIYHKDTPVRAVGILIEGQVSMKLAHGEITLEAGDGIGFLDLFQLSHSCDYVALTDVVVDSYPYRSEESFRQLFDQDPTLAPTFIWAALKQFFHVEELYSMTKYRCNALYTALMEFYRDYTRFSKQYALPTKHLPGLENVQPLELGNTPYAFLSRYYKDMENICLSESLAPLFERRGFVIGFLLRVSQDLHLYLTSYEEMYDYISELSILLINEDHLDFVDLYTTILVTASHRRQDILPINAAISRMFIRAKGVSSIDMALYKDRLSEYQELTKALSHMQQINENDQEAHEKLVLSQLKNAALQILGYAQMSEEFSADFMKDLNAYKAVTDKNAASDELNQLRSRLCTAFYELYTQAFFISHTKDIPVIMKMFFYFGFIDEELCGQENAIYLYDLGSTYGNREGTQVYPFYDYLVLILNGEKQPHKNEFDQDYNAYLQTMLRDNSITQAEFDTLSSDQKQKVQFELRQLLPAGGKVTYGRPALFCPLLSEHDFLRPAENCCLTFHAIKEALQNVLAVDFSAYYRDYIYTSPLLATTHEVLQHEILPDIILMPNIGTRGILWQEIEGHDRQTPASMLLPAICLSDIHLMMLRLTGEFRWEMCKRVQGARWNDVTDHSLTSEFFDYLQFYKKNRDLSADAKEKCHMQLQKAKNRFKDAFILDYMAWVLYESAGSPRLNKVTRQILSRYCPFPKEYREKLKTNPLYTSLFERYENNKKKELTRMNSVAFRAQRNNHGQTPEPLLAQIEYLEK